MKDALRKVNRVGGIVLVLAALGSLASCAMHKPFVLFDEKTVIKSGTIAVISGDGSDATVRLAEALTKELRERSTFKVLSQAKVGLRVGKYPVTIMEGQPENPEKPVWFGKGEKAKVDAMQAQLKVHYLFVVWTDFSRSGTATSYDVKMNGNVVEYPKARVIGYSQVSGSSPSTKGSDVSQLMKDAAAGMADKFIAAANAQKAGKAAPASEAENP
jgi:hypothetical protein